jgi:hypothetical protein
MAEDKPAYAGLDEETIKRNADVMAALAECVPSPSQAAVDSVATGHSKAEEKAEDKEEKAEAKTATTEQKDAAAEEPKASYKTRTVKPAEEK